VQKPPKSSHVRPDGACTKKIKCQRKGLAPRFFFSGHGYNFPKTQGQMKAAPTLKTTNMETTILDVYHGPRLMPSQTTIPGKDRPAQLREYVDSVVLDALIKHPELTEYRKTLESYRDTGRGGERIVTYAPSASARNRGRYYADKGLSMQSFPRRIRHTLAKTIGGAVLYHDIDMVNAHPVLLSQICEHNKWSAEHLTRYVCKRDPELQAVMDAYHVDRDEAKELFIRLMYGGRFRSWAKDNNIAYEASTPFLEQLERETSKIMELIWTHPQFTEFRDIVENNHKDSQAHPHPTQSNSITKLLRKNPKASCMSLVLQDIEHQILMQMERFFATNGYETSVRVFDGLQLVAKCSPNSAIITLPPDLLRKCEAHVLRTIGFHIQLAEKHMNEALDIRTIAAVSGPLTEDAWKHKYIKALLIDSVGRWRWNKQFEKIGEHLFNAGISLSMFQQLSERFVGKKARDECTQLYTRLDLAATQELQSQAKQPGVQKDEAAPPVQEDEAAGGAEEDEAPAGEGKEKPKPHKAEDTKWMKALRSIERMAQKDNQSAFHGLRPIFDFQCPYTIDDLLCTTSLDRAEFLIPKVMARITGTTEEQWIKKTRHDDGTTKFVVMKNLSLLRSNVWTTTTAKNGDELPKSVPLQRVVSDTAQLRGLEMNFSSLDFIPYTGQRQPHTIGTRFNMFGGFPFQEMPGSFESIDWSPIQPILDFMRTLICGGGGGDNVANEATATKEWTFLQDFFCDMLQYPERKPRVCLVLYSKEQQIGKGAIARWLGQALYGNYFQQIDDENHILGDFTSVLSDHILINVDESSKHGQSYTLCGKLKNKISEPTISITRKGFDQYYITSAHRFIYCVNWKEALDIELFDMRFAVYECNPCFRGQKEKFEQIDEVLNANKALLWNYFRKRPIKKHWNKKIPMTAAKRSIVQTKYPSIIQFVLQCPKFWQGQTALTALTANSPSDIIWHWDTLYQHYREWARDQQILWFLQETREFVGAAANHRNQTWSRSGACQSGRLRQTE
jgi:hypothetical protein